MRIRVHPNNKLNIYIFIIIIKVKKNNQEKESFKKKKSNNFGKCHKNTWNWAMKNKYHYGF